MPSDKVLKTKQVYCATPEAKEKMKETGGQGDEADSGLIKVFMGHFSVETAAIDILPRGVKEV